MRQRLATSALSFAMALAASGLFTSPSFADAGGTLTPPQVPTPKAPPGDGATAEQILKQLETLDVKLAAVVAEPVKQAKRALERAHGARVSGDTAHARLLDALALEWAKTAETLSRAKDSEEKAGKKQKEARDVGTQVDRGRTLLEETQARKGRAEAELARVEAEAKKAAEEAKAVEDARLNGGKKGKGDSGAKGKANAPKKGDVKKTDAKQPAPKGAK